MSEKWKPKRMWTRNGSTFAVEISVHTVPVPVHDDDDDGPWRWTVYVYVRKNHPWFAKFDGNDMCQDAASMMPLHGGCSYLRRLFDDDEKVSCIKVGADYNHLHDEWFNRQEEMM